MVVDFEARKKLAEEKRHNELLSAIMTPKVEPPTNSREGINVGVKFLMDEKFLDAFQKNSESEKLTFDFFQKLGKGLVYIYNAIRAIKVNFPKSYFVHGKVDVNEVQKLPPVEIKNFKELKDNFQNIESRIAQLATAVSLVPSTSASSSKVEKANFKVDFSRVEELLDKIDNGISGLAKKEVSMPRSVEVTNFPPTYVPTPVTNININPLRGFVHTTAATVTTALTPLPTYGVLNNRRSMIVYNNSVQTVYIGGSNVTTANGLPVPKNTYSPPIDAGPRMVLYGVVSAGSSDVRVMELSNDSGA